MQIYVPVQLNSKRKKYISNNNKIHTHRQPSNFASQLADNMSAHKLRNMLMLVFRNIVMLAKQTVKC